MTELGPSARALIAASRHGDDPGDDDRERARRKLAAQLPPLAAAAVLSAAKGGAAQVGPGTAEMLGSSATAGALVKSAVVFGAALAAITTAVVIGRGAQPALRPRAAQAAAVAVAAAPAAAPASDDRRATSPVVTQPHAIQPELAASRRQPAAVANDPARLPTRNAAATASAARTVPTPRKARGIVNPGAQPASTVRATRINNAPPRRSARAQDLAASVPVTTLASTGVVANAPSPSITSAAAEVDESISVPASEGPPPALPSLSPELTLLAAARDALRRGDPARALALTERHAFRFPHGALEDERHALRALALCALRRFEEGRRALHALAASSAAAPLLAGARRACAAGQRLP